MLGRNIKHRHIDAVALYPLEDVGDLVPLTLQCLLVFFFLGKERCCGDPHAVRQEFCHVNKFSGLDTVDQLSGHRGQACSNRENRARGVARLCLAMLLGHGLEGSCQGASLVLQF